MSKHVKMWGQTKGTDKPRIIGHRGASAKAPENTIAAFSLAAAMGADAVELDVQLSRDKELVVFHDQTLERTTNGNGRVSSANLEDLKNLDAGSHFHPMFKGEKIPTLEEVFREFQGMRGINVELKSLRFERLLVEKTYKCIYRNNMQGRILISSFNPFLLIEAYKINKEIPIGLLVTRGVGKIMRYFLQKIVQPTAFHPEDVLVTRKMIKGNHNINRTINCWTVDDSERINQLRKWGIDGIITNHPDLAKRVLNTVNS